MKSWRQIAPVALTETDICISTSNPVCIRIKGHYVVWSRAVFRNSLSRRTHKIITVIKMVLYRLQISIEMYFNGLKHEALMLNLPEKRNNSQVWWSVWLPGVRSCSQINFGSEIPGTISIAGIDPTTAGLAGMCRDKRIIKNEHH